MPTSNQQKTKPARPPKKGPHAGQWQQSHWQTEQQKHAADRRGAPRRIMKRLAGKR